METLRKGSTGETVKLLQKSLGIVQDGIFGDKTHSAVVSFQVSTGLEPDGIVGMKTWGRLGFVDTDKQIVTVENGITYEQYYLPDGQYIKADIPKQWVFLHHTAGHDNPYGTVDGWARDTRGQIATEFVLGGCSVDNSRSTYDGTLLQCMPAGSYGWHLGIGNTRMHWASVGIELCSFGILKNNKTYVGTNASKYQVSTLDKPFRGSNTYHRYSENQLRKLEQWLLFIAERDSIDIRKGLIPLIKQKGADAFDMCSVKYCEDNPGVYCHSNVILGKSDLHPQWELIDMLLSI